MSFLIKIKWFDSSSELEVLENDKSSQKVKARHVGHYAENWFSYSEILNFNQIK